MPRGATVLVIGGGIMGLLTMVLARRSGAKRLILSDPIEERRAIAHAWAPTWSSTPRARVCAIA